jgi:hypothetical protein
MYRWSVVVSKDRVKVKKERELSQVVILVRIGGVSL